MMSAIRSVAARSAVVVCVILAMALSSAAPIVVAQPYPDWQGEYFNNPNIQGDPTFTRNDADINFDWGSSGIPGPGLGHDNFSVRWTRSYNFTTAGTYTFYTRTDDGVRLWVDDQLLIDQWRDMPATTFSANIYLTAGNHSLRVEYYQHLGLASAQVWWEGGQPSYPNWKGEYFNNPWLSGAPVFTRNDINIDFDWGSSGIPGPGLGHDNFSVRWTQNYNFTTPGTYNFCTRTDDGVRLWVDNQLIIDQWHDMPATMFCAYWNITYGLHPIKMEYYQHYGYASAQLWWSGGPTPPTEVIVDDRDPGFSKGGPYTGWHEAPYGYRYHMFWTNNASSQPSNWGRWIPILSQPGRYEVYVYIPSHYATTRNAQYQIFHSGTYDWRSVNQLTYYNRWVSIGTYYFAANGQEYVYLSDLTYEPYLTTWVGFDAVKFVYRGP
jgi:hypothetical protein